MKLAVLMSTYNGERFLKEQIDSILQQKTDGLYTLIVRDDGSTDGTIRILKEYADEGKLQFVQGLNLGAARSFLSLLQDYPGYDYYAFSDQDDVWGPDKLQKGIDSIKEFDGPALYCSNCELVDAELKSIGRNTHRKLPSYTLESILCLASCAQGCTSVFNKQLAMTVQKNPIPKMIVMHDSMLTCLCGLIGGTIIYDAVPSMKYRIHGKNIFGIASAKQGVSLVIKDRIREITQKRKISMSDQAQSLLDTYGELISTRNQEICRMVIASKTSISARLALVFSKKLRHDTLNKTLTQKFQILFGNG